jgi:hydroxymethylpyrimidine/phosphomethylpyrimidine kinase
VGGNGTLSSSITSKLAKGEDNEEIIKLNSAKLGGNSEEIDRLREENKRLKRTLLERFE